MGDLAVIEADSQLQRRHPGGRPTLYNQDKARAICEHLEKGLTRRSACALEDVNEETFRFWCDTREEFLQMVLRADAKAETLFTEAMRRGAEGDPEYKGDWKAGESWLKRRRRADYGDTINVNTIDTAKLLELYLAAKGIEQDEPTPAPETLEDVL